MVSEGVRHRLSDARFTHTLSVAALARKLAVKHGLDGDKAYLAGLIHDYAKEIPGRELKSEILKHRKLNDVEEAFPHILHAEVGVLQARRDLGVDDSEVAEAAGAHTLAGENLGPLSKILFMADFVEPGRSFPGVLQLRGECEGPLETAFRACLEAKITHLISKGLPLHPRMTAAWNQAVLPR